MGRTKGTKGSEAGNLSVSKRGTKGRGKDQNSSINKTGFDGSMSAPWRKTVSIFKQPVTLVHTSKRDSKICKGEEAQARRSGGNGKKEKPLQVPLSLLDFFTEMLYLKRSMFQTWNLVVQEESRYHLSLDITIFP